MTITILCVRQISCYLIITAILFVAFLYFWTIFLVFSQFPFPFSMIILGCSSLHCQIPPQKFSNSMLTNGLEMKIFPNFCILLQNINNQNLFILTCPFCKFYCMPVSLWCKTILFCFYKLFLKFIHMACYFSEE